MKLFFRLALAGVCLTATLLWTPVASAHPLGNFTINHYAGLHLNPQAVTVDYVLDMAEIPAFQELEVMDTNRNGKADPAEIDAYNPAQCAAISSDLALRVEQRQVVLTVVESGISFPPGAGGLQTLRLTCAFSAPIALAGESAQVEFEDESYADRLGWREIVVTGDEVTLAGEFATSSLSQRLSVYPDDLLSSPLDERGVAFDLTTRPAASEAPSPGTQDAESAGATLGRGDRFTQLITVKDLSLPAIVLALAVAFVWGAMHALTPGHGKTIVGAYLVGSRGTARHAFYLGLITTLTHTAGVFVLGLAVLAAANFVRAEQLLPWLSAASGLLVVGMGASLLFRRLRGMQLAGLPMGDHTGSAHTHDHDDHDHAHTHAHGHGHTHLPPDGAGAPVTWRSLLGLGISGGLLPCPSALVVMLSAVALDRVAFGLLLILTFSFGLASVLTGIGLIFIYTNRLFDRRLPQNRAVRLLPAVSALFIALAGVGITLQALAQLGVPGL